MAKVLLQIFLQIFFSIFFKLNIKYTVPLRMKKTVDLYQDRNFTGLFAQIRAWDAPFENIEKLVPKKGVIIDLGCGDGLLANFLALTGQKRNILGIELNQSRVSIAYKGLKNTSFVCGDVLQTNFPKANSILLIHLLHHLSSPEDQKILITRCRNQLRANGKGGGGGIGKKPILKYCLSWITDAIIFPILFEDRLFRRNFFYRNENEWRIILENSGFRVKKENAHNNKPFPHIIYECQKV